MAENGCHKEQLIRRGESSRIDPNFHGSNPFSVVLPSPKTDKHLMLTITYSATSLNGCPCGPAHSESDRRRLSSSMNQLDLGHAADGPLSTGAHRMSVYERQLHFEHILQKGADHTQQRAMNREQFYETHFAKQKLVVGEVGVKTADEFNHSYCASLLNSDLWALYPKQIASVYGRNRGFSCTANTTCRSTPSPEANRFCKTECNRSRSLDQKKEPFESDASSFYPTRVEMDSHFCKGASWRYWKPEYPAMDTCISPSSSTACRQSRSKNKACTSLLLQRLYRPDLEPSVSTIQSKPPHPSRSQSLPVRCSSGSRNVNIGPRRLYAVTYIYNATLDSTQNVMVNDQRRSAKGQLDPYPDIGVPSTYEVFYPFASNAELNGYLITRESTALQSLPTCEGKTQPVDEFEGQCLSYRVIPNKPVSVYKLEQGYSGKMAEATHRKWFCEKSASPSPCSPKFTQFSENSIRTKRSPRRVIRPVSPAKTQAREQSVASFMRITDKEISPKPGSSTTHTKPLSSSPVKESLVKHPVRVTILVSDTKSIDELNPNKPPSGPIELNPTPNLSPKLTKYPTLRSGGFTTASVQSTQSATSRRTPDKSVKFIRTVETNGESVSQTNFERKPRSLSLLVHDSASSLNVPSKDDYRDLVQHVVAAVFSAPPLYHWGSIVLPNSPNVPRLRQPPKQVTSDIARISANMNPKEFKDTTVHSSSTEPPSPYFEVTYADSQQPTSKPMYPSDTSVDSVPEKLQPLGVFQPHSPQKTQATKVTDTDRLTAPQSPLPRDITPVDGQVAINKDVHKPSETTHTLQPRSSHSQTVEKQDVSTVDSHGVPSADAHRIHGASSPVISSPVSKTPEKIKQRKPSPTESDNSSVPTEHSITLPDSRQRTPDKSEPSRNSPTYGTSASSFVVKPPSGLYSLSEEATQDAVTPSISPKLSKTGSESLVDQADIIARPPSNEPVCYAESSKVDSDEVSDSTIPQTTSKPFGTAEQSVDKYKLTRLIWPSTCETKSPEKTSSVEMTPRRRAPCGTINPGSVEVIGTSTMDYPGVSSADGHQTYGANSPLISRLDSKTSVRLRTQNHASTEKEDSLITTVNSPTRPDSRLRTLEHSEPAVSLSVGAPSSTLLLSESTFRPQTLDIKTTPIISPNLSVSDTADKEEHFVPFLSDLQTPPSTIVNMDLNTRKGSPKTNSHDSFKSVRSPYNPKSRIPSPVQPVLPMRSSESASSSFGSNEPVSLSKNFLTPVRTVEELEPSSTSYRDVPSTNAHRVQGTINHKRSELTVPLLPRPRLNNRISNETISDFNKQSKPKETTQPYSRTLTGTGSGSVPPAAGRRTSLAPMEVRQSKPERKLIKQLSLADATGPSTQKSLRLPLHDLPALSVIEHPSETAGANAIQPVALNQLSDARQTGAKPNDAQQPVVGSPKSYSNESSDVSSVDPMMTMRVVSLNDRSNGSNATPTRSSHQNVLKVSTVYVTYNEEALDGRSSSKPVRNPRQPAPVDDRIIPWSGLANVIDNQPAQLQTSGAFWTTPTVREQCVTSQLSSGRTSVGSSSIKRKRNVSQEHNASFHLSDKIDTAERVSKLKSSPLHSVVLNEIIVTENDEVHRTHGDTRRISAVKRKMIDLTAEFSRSVRLTHTKTKCNISQSSTSFASKLLSARELAFALKPNDLSDEFINQSPSSQPEWDDGLLSSDLSVEQGAANLSKNKQDDVPRTTNVTKLLKSLELKEVQISSHLSSKAQRSDGSNPTSVITDEFEKFNLNPVAGQTTRKQSCSGKDIKTPNLYQSEDKQKSKKIAAAVNVYSSTHYHMPCVITDTVIKKAPSKISSISNPPCQRLSEDMQVSTGDEVSDSVFSESGPMISTERKQQAVPIPDYQEQGRSVHSSASMYNPTEFNIPSPNTGKSLSQNKNMIPSTAYHSSEQAEGTELTRPALSHVPQVSGRPSLRRVLTERSVIHHELTTPAGTSSPPASKPPFKRHMSTVAGSSTLIHPTCFEAHIQKSISMVDSVRSCKLYDTWDRFSCKSFSTNILPSPISSLPAGEVPSPSFFELNAEATSTTDFFFKTTEVLEDGKDLVQYPLVPSSAFGSKMRRSSSLPEKVNLTAGLQNPVDEHSSVQVQYPVDSLPVNLSKLSSRFPLGQQPPSCKGMPTSTDHAGFAHPLSPKGHVRVKSSKDEYSTSSTDVTILSVPDPAVVEESTTDTCRCNRCCTVVEQDLVIITSPGDCTCELPSPRHARYHKGCVYMQNSRIPVLQSKYSYHHPFSPIYMCEVIPSSGQAFPSSTTPPLTTVFIENCSTCHCHNNAEGNNNNMIRNLFGSIGHPSPPLTRIERTHSHPAFLTTSMSDSEGVDTICAQYFSPIPHIAHVLPVEPMDLVHVNSDEKTDWEFFEEKQSEQSENTVYLSKRSSMSSGSTYHLIEQANVVTLPNKEFTEALNKNNCCDPEVNFENINEEDNEYDQYCNEDSLLNTRGTHRAHSQFSHCLRVPVPHSEDQQTCHHYEPRLGPNYYHDDGYFLAPVVVQRSSHTSTERAFSRGPNILEDRPISTSPQSSQLKETPYSQHSKFDTIKGVQLRYQMRRSLSGIGRVSEVGFRRDKGNYNMCSTSAFPPTKLDFAAHALHNLKEQSPYAYRHQVVDKNCSVEVVQRGVYLPTTWKTKHHCKPPSNSRDLVTNGLQTPYLSKHKWPEREFRQNKKNVPQFCQNFSNPNMVTQIKGQGSQRTSTATLYFDKQAVFVRGEANNDQTKMLHQLYTTNNPKVVPFKTRSSQFYSALPVDISEVTARHARYDPLRHGTVHDLVYTSNKITPEAQDILADIRGTVEMIMQDLMALESQILDKNFRLCEAISEHLVLLPKMLIALLDHLHYSPIELELVKLTSGLSSLIEEVASDPVTVLFHLLELGYRLNELAKLFGEDLVPACLPKLVHAIQSKLYRMKIGHVARQYLHVPQSGDHLLTSYAKSRHLLRLEEDCGCQVNLIHPEDPRAIYCPHDYRTIEVVYDEDRGKPELFFHRLNSLISPRRQCIRLVATIVRQINGREFAMKAEDAKELLSCNIRPRFQDVRAIIMSSGKRLIGIL
ncbi:hypothetical protein P879_09217 [Paragonimus westermani]|uniref:Uncharacterized protein n=1 Tax=Paragonimus westermani TaxID=34504 RepID=A0A8T0DAD3_9TREM|nr:hypothetical protein P879_09217 [Paragonimus westermani]